MLIAIIITVVVGVLVGNFAMPTELITYLEPITTFSLAVLLLGVGIDIGNNKDVIIKLKEFGFKILLVPILIALGSIIGAVVSGGLLNLPFNEASAVGAGFGWYSLSGVIISKIYSSDLGALAFLTNVFRELIAILLIPLLAKLGNKILVIAPGGATTMDTTLPLITKSVKQKEIAVIAFISGAVLSSLVPVLVPLLVNL